MYYLISSRYVYLCNLLLLRFRLLFVVDSFSGHYESIEGCLYILGKIKPLLFNGDIESF